MVEECIKNLRSGILNSNPLITSRKPFSTPWEDSDDEREVINLNKNPKLQKLIYLKGEEVISVSELQSRLRKLHSKNTSNEINSSKTYSQLAHTPHSESQWVEKARKRKQKYTVSEFKIPSLGAEFNLTGSDDDQTLLYNHHTGQNSLLSNTDSLTDKSNSLEPKRDKIWIKKLGNNINKGEAAGSIQSLEFHKNSHVLFSTSKSRQLGIYRIDDDSLQHVESLKIQNFPIEEAKFNNDHTDIFLLSNRKALINYNITTGQKSIIPGIAGRSFDMSYSYLTFGHYGNGSYKSSSLFAISPSGKGTILLCDTSSKRLIRTLSMNSETTGISFHPSRNHIFTSDRDAYIYEWDICSGKCLNRFKDTSSLKVSCLATSHCSSIQYLATGSVSGFLNLYELKSISNCFSQPVKIFSNLTTKISDIKFHPSNELLAYSSPIKNDALKLIHLPTMTIFANWPNLRENNLHQVTSISFSEQGGYFVVGNKKGIIQLFKLKNFF